MTVVVKSVSEMEKREAVDVVDAACCWWYKKRVIVEKAFLYPDPMA